MKRIMALFMRLMGRRTCEDVVAVLQEYFEETLDPQLAAIIERHFEGCPDCRAFARSYREVSVLTRELSCDEIPEEVRLRVRDAIRERLVARR